VPIPTKKNVVPLILCRWKKKKNVFSIPMRKPSPERNNSCVENIFLANYEL